MSEVNKQRLKLLYLMKIFSEDTDDEHMLTLPQIIGKLKAYGVDVERKTLYQDFVLLRDFGFDIVRVKTQRNHYYHIGNREFEQPELKMMQISVVDKKREGKEQFKAFDMPRYTKSLFGMYGGEEVRVTLEAENQMVGILIDCFGKDIPIKPVDENHFRTIVNVAVSGRFLGWIMALDEGVRIVGPAKVLECMKQKIGLLNKVYKD